MNRTPCAAAALAAAALLLASPALALDPETPPKPAPAPSADAALDVALGVEERLVATVASVRDLTVAVFQKQRPSGPKKEGRTPRGGAGSGVLLVTGGVPYVLTNAHVVDGADQIQVRTADGATYDMKEKDQVAAYDIALLEFRSKPPTPVRGARVGKSSALREGQWVIATGNPFMLASDGGPVATLGVVSGLDRNLPGQFHYPNAIQHDAEVNPGSSGGPLWNLEGELVGLNGKIATRSTLATNTGASFAVPIDLVMVYLRMLVDDRVRAAPSYTGLRIVTHTDGLGTPLGARVATVATDSPCGKAKSPASGLQTGDLVVRIGHGGRDYDVRTATDWENAMASVAPGTRVQLTYARAGQRLSWVGALGAAR
jgi:S1-C subfamily serine protease